jgi:hypothetical protein
MVRRSCRDFGDTPESLAHTWAWLVTAQFVSFVVLNYQGKVPAMASCAKRQRKFFPPPASFIVILLVHRNTCSESVICTIVPVIRRDERRFSRGTRRKGESILVHDSGLFRRHPLRPLHWEGI